MTTFALFLHLNERAGYRSEFAFAKAFKRSFGQSPGGFRGTA